jgi:glycosyltransferase involved in cell wall biosynthesis
VNSGTPRVFCSLAALEASPKTTIAARVIPNGFTLPPAPAKDQNRAAFLASVGFPTGTRLLVSVGAMRRQKNYTAAVSALAELKRSCHDFIGYVICGDRAEDTPEIESAIQRFGVAENVRLLGVRSDTAGILHFGDCYLNTSHHEGLSIAILEALATGIPCVVSDIPGNRVFGDAPGCTLVSRNDAASVAAAIAAFLRQGGLASEYRARRAAMLASYSIRGCALQYCHFFEELIAAASSRSSRKGRASG